MAGGRDLVIPPTGGDDLQSWDWRMWRHTLNSTRTWLDSSLRPYPSWICVWQNIVALGCGCPSGGGNRGAWNWRVGVKRQGQWKWRIWRIMGTRRTTKTEGYTVANNILGMEPIYNLASDLGLEPHLPTMSMLGVHGDHLEIYI